ncbi:MAG: TonB-dependent receptor [Rhodobacteraceae bacterium]|nr:TonB-dependent receptor [Paracoccaceae bacterium]
MIAFCSLYSLLAVSGRRIPLPPRLAVALLIAAAACLVPLPDEAEARVVTVIDRQDMEMSGAANLSELLTSRFEFNSFGLHGARSGTGRAIYLVNGRPVSGIYLTMIPLSAVERVEILNEGPVRHSAYGIGSTVNIVLRNDIGGLEVSAGTALPSQKGMDARNGSALWSGALGPGHLTVGFMHFGREELRARDRDFSRTMYTPGGSYTDAEGVSDDGNTVILPKDDNDRGGRFGLGDCEEPTYTGILSHPGGEVCGFPSADIYWLRSRVSRASLQLAVDQPLDNGAEVYVEARVSRGKTFSVSTPNSDTISIKPTGAARQRLLDAVINLPEDYDFPDDTDDETDGVVTLLHRFIGHGNRELTTNLEEYGLTLGVQGKLDDALSYDMHVEYFRDRAVENVINLQSLSLIRAAIEEGTYDIVNPLSEEDDHLEAIRDTRLRSSHDADDEYLRAKASLEGETFRMAGGVARWTAGVEVQKWNHWSIYDFRDARGRSYENADVIGYGGGSSVADRSRWSAMAESTLPILDSWDLTVGARRDNYDDVGKADSLHVANRYRLNDDLALRASWSRAAHPPTFFWLHLPQAQYFTFICDPLLEDDNGGPLCDWVHVITGGNPNLKPSNMERINLGTTMTLGDITFAADWFSVNNTGMAGIPAPQVVVERAAEGNPLPGTSVERNVAGDNSIDVMTVSVGPVRESRTRGLALRASVDWETDWADFALDIHATRTLQQKTYALGEEEPGGYVRDRASAVLQAHRGNFTANWNVYARSGYPNRRETARFKRWYGHDMVLQWRDVMDTGLDLTGGVFNISNRGATPDPSDQDGHDRSFDSDRGRTIFLNATMRW